MSEGCPEEILKGIDEFNRSQFYQCHETLEQVWMKKKGNEREFIQAIIQLAVGYYHYERNNQVGALKLFKAGSERLRRYEPSCLEIDVSKLIKAVETNIDQLSNSGINGDMAFKVPAIEFISH